MRCSVSFRRRLIQDAKWPDEVKRLGRQVKNFDDRLWLEHLEETAFEVVLQKFQAVPSLRETLLSTGNATLVEAAPSDFIWGIGLSKTDPRALHPQHWRGRNVLGYALMRARSYLRGEREPDAFTDSPSADQAGASAEPKQKRCWGNRQQGKRALRRRDRPSSGTGWEGWEAWHSWQGQGWGDASQWGSGGGWGERSWRGDGWSSCFGGSRRG